MKTITVSDIPENKYNLVMEFLKALKLKVMQDFKTSEKKTVLFLLDALIAKIKLDNIYQH